jgi:hypothetical protein
MVGVRTGGGGRDCNIGFLYCDGGGLVSSRVIGTGSCIRGFETTGPDPDKAARLWRDSIADGLPAKLALALGLDLLVVRSVRAKINDPGEHIGIEVTANIERSLRNLAECLICLMSSSIQLSFPWWIVSHHCG